MQRHSPQNSIVLALVGFTALFIVLMILARSLQNGALTLWNLSSESAPTAALVLQATSAWGLPTRRPPGAPLYTSTPDNPHPLPPLRKEAEQYMVQAGDTLGRIAERYGVSIEQIAQSNQISDPNVLAVGQVLLIPVPTPGGSGPAFKIIPDSELVYGPASIGFDLEKFIQQQGGYLAYYREQLPESTQALSGAQIVQSVAQDYSVNPRLLLAFLQYQSGWLTDPAPERSRREYPLGLPDPSRQGLFRQLSWAANALNHGFYQWRTDQVAAWVLSDSSIVPINPTLNAGTAGVQYALAQVKDLAGWENAVSAQGLFAVYQDLFGYPFELAVEPPLPPGLAQPPMQLPFETGAIWSFTGGPHAAWGDGAAWAALDFGPPGETKDCAQNNAWVTAVADGLVLRAADGIVILDLDSDGYEQSGWVVLYLHIEGRDRVQPGAFLRAGERLGHPSCEGGFSVGTHVHIARRYNGEWVLAGSDNPFVLDGWVASSAGSQYDGYLERGGQRIEAYGNRSPENEVQR